MWSDLIFDTSSRSFFFDLVFIKGSVAEWSKALVLGTSPKGRGFESHSCQKYFTDHTQIFKSVVAPGEARTHNPGITLCTVYKYRALTDCATGAY